MDTTARAQWANQLSSLGGKNPLTHFEPSSFGQVDLSKSHPGGLAQLVTSRSSKITNLVRDGVAQGRALSAARRIKQHADRLENDFGLESVFIAAGLIRVVSDGRSLPILLWPTKLIQKSEDYDLRITEEPIINPACTTFLRERNGSFREDVLLNLVAGQSDLIPLAVLDQVSSILQTLDVEVEKTVTLGNFLPDLLLLRAQPLGETSELIETLLTTDKLEFADYQERNLCLVANADSTQQEVITRALNGESFVVETLPGCGYLQTVVNLISNLAIEGKRTLVLAPRKQTLDELIERSAGYQVPGLGIRVDNVWNDLVAAISRNEKVQPVGLAQAREALTSATTPVRDYFEALESTSNPMAISLLQAMTELAALAVLPNPPVNQARISASHLEENRAAVLDLLARAHQAKVFAFGPNDTAWFGARFESNEQIGEAIRVAKELANSGFAQASSQINEYLAKQNLTASNSVEQWALRLRLLLGIRETLDKFQPSIFDRPLHELIAATAPRKERGGLSGSQRRRFKKLAKQYLRPGASVPDLHLSLSQAQEQRDLWEQLHQTQAPPTVPLGLNEVHSAFEELLQKLDLLQKHLSPSPDFELLTRETFAGLTKRLASLANQTEILEHYMDRLPILAELESHGLRELTEELCKLNPTVNQVELEYDLAWWQSAFETIVSADPRILNYSQEKIADIEQKFEQAANEVIHQGPAEVSDRLSQVWKTAVQKYPAQADALRAQLRARRISALSAKREAGPLWDAISPAVLVSPLAVHQLSPTEAFDVVLVLDAASVGMAESVPGISRAKQVIAFGDPVIALAQDFETVAKVTSAESLPSRQSAYEFLAERLPVATISQSYRIEGQVLGNFLNQNFYDGRIEIEPNAGQLFGAHNFELVEITTSNRASTTIEGATESLDSEVAKTVELVMNHARWSPEQSLLVVTASKSHADRIQSGVQNALLGQHQLAEFFDAHGREAFEVTTMQDLTHRLADRVIFSVGFGRTPEGKVSGSLGFFDSAQAPRMLANLIISARKKFTLVSCYNASDFEGKLSQNHQLLAQLVRPTFLSDLESGHPDPLLRDLALRLEKLGLTVRLNFASRIGLAVNLGNKAAVVDPDWGLRGDSWDEKLRLRPGLLRAMGWKYIRVHALEIFSHPQDVAHRVAKELGLDVERKPEPLFEKAFEDTGRAWGDPDDSNDDRLRNERPPHWG